ncbi:MAG TPA: PPOX class F420-dependent oxidoreductase [Nitrososphaeraceae archaeon]|jgi:PPOX class probable F420-dependent enzyme|nr:PPOX class F420-dependent oxidoreductase [Nitrososphaeraceae archaeon]
MSRNKISQFLNQKYINLETYRKNGQAVQTPVWFAIDGSIIYVRTDSNSGKIKRARNNPHVRLTPSNARGQPKGEWIDGEIKIASTSESERANQLLRQKYGLQGKIIRMVNKIRKTKPIVVSIKI